MLEWASVYWLAAALAAVPLIWWLHRLRRPESRHRVSALFLWKGQAADEQPGIRPVAAESGWWLRALIAASLCTAAAGPMWSAGAGRAIEIWLDDSLSMRAREAEGARYEKAIDRLINALRDSEAGTVTVRSLVSPGKKLTLTLPVSDQWRRRLSGWFQVVPSPLILPSPVQMNPQADHWLVTDGAAAELASWLEDTPVGRIIRVGQATENTGLTRISLRRSLRDHGAMIGQVEIRNFGARPSKRRLVVRVGNRVVHRETVNLAPGAHLNRTFRFDPDGAAALEARILGVDALPADDSLVLAYGRAAGISVRISGKCGRALRIAIKAHPAVYPAAGGEAPSPAALTVACGRARPVARGPVIWVRRSDDVTAVRAVPHWTASSGRLQDVILAPAWLRRVSVAGVQPGFEPLLVAGDAPLILLAKSASRRMVEVRLDFARSALAGRPEFPALIAGLIELALGYSPIEAYAETGRRAAAGVIRPRDLAAPAARSPNRTVGRRVDLAPYLIAMALALLLLDTGWSAARRRRRVRHAAQSPVAEPRAVAALMRLGLAALLLAALWNPPLPWPGAARDIIVVLDDSLSMKQHFDRGLWSRIAKRIAQFPPDTRIGLIRYGAKSAVELPLGYIGDARLRTVFESPDPPRRKAVSRWATDTKSALTAALRLAIPGRAAAIMLITDGLDTRGDVGAALQHAQTAGVPVFWFDPRQGKQAGDRWIEDLRVPATARSGAEVPIVVALDGEADRRVRLLVTADHRTISDTVLSLGGGGPVSHRVRFVPRDPGDYEISALLEGSDDVPENNIRAAILHVAGQLPVLIVSRKVGGTAIGRSLTAGGQAVVEIEPGRFPQRADGLRSRSTIVLDDIAVGDMSDVSWNALSKAVGEIGVGLVVLGGPRSFASGGYRHSKLEALLPLIAEAGDPQGRAAVQFVVDKSGSMDRDQAGTSRFSHARRAVVETARGLVKGDYIGLIWFDVAAHTALPLDLYPDPAAAVERAWTVRPSGGTALTSALRAALDRLSDSAADRRLLVLVTDGQVPAGEDLAPLYRRIRDEGVDVISLVVGKRGAAVEPLARLSALNDGVLRHIGRVAELPRIMRREVETRRNPTRLGRFAPRRKATVPYLATAGSWPLLSGYMVTRARPAAQVYLESDDGDPLFAMGRFGAGRVAALPGGLGGWAKAWPKWRHWGRFVSGLVQSVAVGNDNPLLDAKIVGEAGRLRFAVDAVASDGEWSRERFASVSLRLGGFGIREFTLPQIAPGHYAGYADVDRPGRYSAVTRVGEQVVRRDMIYAADREFRPVRGAAGLAEFVKDRRVLPLPAGGPAATADAAIAAGPARPLLLFIAIGWFLLLLVHHRAGLHPRRLASGAGLLFAQVFHRQRDPGS